MDLIYREKLADKLTALDMPKGIEKEQYFIVMCNVIHALFDAPAVEAVPLEPLCEWLADHYSINCEKWCEVYGLKVCPYLKDQEMYRCNSPKNWEALLTKLMEEQHG